MEGCLWKRGHRRKNWKRRMFVLEMPNYVSTTTATLKYKEEGKLEIKGSLSVTPALVIDVVPHTQFKRDFVLRLRTRPDATGKEELYIQASSPDELREWVTALEFAMEAGRSELDGPRTADPADVDGDDGPTAGAGSGSRPTAVRPRLLRRMSSSLVLRRGTLFKVMAWRDKLEPRFCELDRSGVLRYFVTEGGKMLGSIDCKEAEFHELTSAQLGGREWAFKLVGNVVNKDKSREILFQASSKEERDLWKGSISQLKAHAARLAAVEAEAAAAEEAEAAAIAIAASVEGEAYYEEAVVDARGVVYVPVS